MRHKCIQIVPLRRRNVQRTQKENCEPNSPAINAELGTRIDTAAEGAEEPSRVEVEETFGMEGGQIRLEFVQ